jgi:hypothetical protein
MIRCLVSGRSLDRKRSLSANETAVRDKPLARAISAWLTPGLILKHAITPDKHVLIYVKTDREMQ